MPRSSEASPPTSLSLPLSPSHLSSPAPSAPPLFHMPLLLPHLLSYLPPCLPFLLASPISPSPRVAPGHWDLSPSPRPPRTMHMARTLPPALQCTSGSCCGRSRHVQRMWTQTHLHLLLLLVSRPPLPLSPSKLILPHPLLVIFIRRQKQ
ncbi:unnamed protein product [Closterium sp. NIES-53]